MGHRPKIGGATLERFWKSVLFRRLRPTPILVDHGSSGIGKVISLSFHAYPILVDHGSGGIGKVISLSFYAYVDHPNWRSYASCTLI
jgi:hypothetical protein